jgi:hypothetical protein
MGGIYITHERHETKSPLGRLQRRWEGNIRMDLSEIGWEYMDCIHLAENRDQWWAVVYTVMNLQFP